MILKDVRRQLTYCCPAKMCEKLTKQEQTSYMHIYNNKNKFTNYNRGNRYMAEEELGEKSMTCSTNCLIM